MFNFMNKFESIKSSLIGIVLILACTIIGFIWISVGLYSLFSDWLGLVWGPVALGALFFLPIIGYAIYKAVAPKDKRSKQQQMFDAAFANSSVGSISRMIETMSQHSPLLAAGVAVIGGFVASRFPQFLSMFSELVAAFGDELSRRNARKAEDSARKAKEDEMRGTPPPPPDVEAPVKRRGKARADSY